MSLWAFLELKVLGAFSSGLGLNSFESCLLTSRNCQKYLYQWEHLNARFFYMHATGNMRDLFLVDIVDLIDGPIC